MTTVNTTTHTPDPADPQFEQDLEVKDAKPRHQGATTQTEPEENNNNPEPKPDPKETISKVDLNECFTFDAGYRNPPRHSMFVRGTSGNPAGRPKGSRNKPKKLNDKNLMEVLRDALFKTVRVNGTATVPAITAVAERMVDLAIGGNMRAIELAFASTRAVEAADAAQQEADYKYALEYKARWEDPMKLMYDGFDRAQPVPLPQHIILDHRNRLALFTGPRNEEEMIKYLAGEDILEEQTEEEDPENRDRSDISDGYPGEKYCEPMPYRREVGDPPYGGDDERLPRVYRGED